MLKMVSNLSRPNFFPGQLIDYKDFNRLASQADRTLSVLCRHLFSGGGILVDALEEFAIEPLGKLKVVVKPGIALLPTGAPSILSKELILDLSPFVSKGKQGHEVVVSLKNSVRAKDKYEDEEDVSISGYRTEALEPELVVSFGQAVEEGVELFRVHLTSPDTELRKARKREEWEENWGSKEEKDGVAIDLRHRVRIVPQTYSPCSVSEFIRVRKALYALEDIHRALAKTYLVEDPHGTVKYLSQLHAEILSRPFQPLKVSFLVSEFSEKLSLYLELLMNRLGHNKPNFDRSRVLKIIERLENLRVKTLFPQKLSLEVFVELEEQMNEVLRFAQVHHSFVNRVEEALLDVRAQRFALDSKLSWAGYVFQRVDLVDFQNKKKLRVRADNSQIRRVSATYRNGDTLSLSGVFVKKGIFSANLEIPNPEQPAVIVFRQYIRRGGIRLQFEINGNPLVTENQEEAVTSNTWINAGIVIPPEKLISEENRFVIRVEGSDLDYGFFELGSLSTLI